MNDRPTSGRAPRWGEYGPPSEQASAPPEPTRAAPLAPAVRGATPARPAPAWDRVLTVSLLVLGLLNVLTGIPQMLRLAEVLDQVYAAQGVGDYTSETLASTLGIAANVVNVLLLVVAVAASVRRLRTGRLAYWIPLVAGAVSVIVTITAMAVAMLGDPAMAAYLEGQTTP